MTETVPFKYRAFLSYSHRDTAWGKWLHGAIEGYRIDKDLVGRDTAVGPVPKTLRPIFRDREDFSAGHSLSAQTLAALEASQFLILLCSPSAAKSPYVDEEVRRFKALGRADRVIPVIVDGEPGDPVHECFPPALRFKLGPDGQPTGEREEPIAADARPQGDGKDIAKQKVVAGLLGVGLDQIVRRAERARKRRNRFWAALAGVFLLLAVLASASAVYAYQKLVESEDRLDQAIEIATGLVVEAVTLSDRLGASADVTLALLKRADGALDLLIERGARSAKLRHRKAVTLISFAGLYEAFGQTAESLRYATEARDIIRELVAQEPDNELWRHSLAVGHLSVGQLLLVKRELAQALDSLRAAAAMLEKLIADDADDETYQRDLLRTRLAVGDGLALQGSIAAAAQSYRDAINGLQEFASAQSTDLNGLLDEYPELVPNTITAVERFGYLLALQGSFTEALTTLQAALVAREHFAKKNPQSASWQNGLLDTRYRIANLHLGMGQPAEAMPQFRKGLEIAETMARADARNAIAQRMAVLFKDGVGRTLLEQGSGSDALALFRTNLDAGKRLVAADAANAEWQGHIAIGHERIGDALMVLADLPGALAEFQTQRSIILALLDRNPNENDWQATLANAQFKIGEVLRAQGARANAQRSYQASLAIRERLAAANADVVVYQVELLKARWRSLEDSTDMVSAYEAILAALRALRDRKKLTAEHLRWLSGAERELARLTALQAPPAQ